MADHQRIFNKFWSWQEEYMDSFTFNCTAKVPNDDWQYKIKEGTTFRKWGEHKGYSVNTIRNWIIQATGAAILYEAVRLVDAAGYRIIGTMHDEIIVEGNSNDVADTGRDSMEAIKELIKTYKQFIDEKDPANNCLDTAIITDPKLRSKKTIKKLKHIAGRALIKNNAN